VPRSVTTPFAAPGQTVTVRREAPVFSANPGGNIVTLHFQPVGGTETTIADILTRVVCGQAKPGDADELASRVATVADEARCALAGQQQRVIGSLLSLFPHAVQDYFEDAAPPDDPVLVASLLDIDGGRAVLDEGHRRKQPDWTFDETYSGQSPADRLDQRLEEASTD